MWDFIYLPLAIYEIERKQEEHFFNSIKELPPDQQLDAIKAHKQAREKAQQFAIEERRHRELCSAIRSRSRWF